MSLLADLSLTSIYSASSSKCAKDYERAYLYPLIILFGATPSSTNVFASFSNSPANKTTEVVPSPTSSSWELAISTNTLAAGWIISNSYKIVAPSFVIYVNLFNLINLSIPLGPNVVQTISTIA